MENNNEKTRGNQREFTITMPDVKDIPGQENVQPPRIREMEDVTISSSDEEGDGFLDELNGNEPATDENTSTDENDQMEPDSRSHGRDGRVIADGTKMRGSLPPESTNEESEE